MKLTILLLISFTLNIGASVYSQNAQFTLDLKGKTVREVFQVLEQQSKFRFFYNDEFSYIDKVVDLNVKNENVQQILEKLFESSDITYRVLDNNLVVLTLKQNLQQVSVTGTVTDASTGEPLIGVSVAVEGTSQGTISDSKGKYSLSQLEPNAILVFTYVSYLTERIPINGQSVIDVKLALDMKKLDEVVVIGYGSVRKSDLTGAVATVKGAELKQLASIDVNQNLQGKVAGVQVISNSGNPAGGTKVRIRGVGTINNADPLYVVDGVPQSAIDYLAPGDIENMEVLKDASATAIYGNRGANGVILVTTKKGSTGAVKFSFDAYAGVSAPSKTLDFINAQQYSALYKEAYLADNKPIPAQELAMMDLVAQQKSTGTDWQKEVFRYSAPMQNYNLNVSGGTDKYKYSVSGTYFSQEGTLRNSKLDKYFIRVTNDFVLSKFFKGGFTASYVNSNFNNYNVNQYYGVLPLVVSTDPITPAWDKSTNNYGNPVYFSQVADNAAHAIDDMANSKTDQNRLRFTAYGEATIIKGLSFKSNFGAYLNDDHFKQFLSVYKINQNLYRNTSRLDENRETDYGFTWSNYFNYIKSIGNHNLNLMVGMESGLDNNQRLINQGYNVPSDLNLQYMSAAQNTASAFINSSQGEATLLSYFGRLNYSYKDKYLLTATIREDGTSRFMSDKRWGFFPSFSLGWNIKKESFLTNVDWLSTLKLLGGYGEVGNQASAGYYDYVTGVSNNQRYIFGTDQTNYVNGAAPISLSNSQLRWEVAKETNFGIETSILNNKFDFSANYFIKKTSEMIIKVPIPEYVGASAPSGNAGSMQNKGFEIAATYREKVGDLNIEIGINNSWIKNEVTNLGGANAAPIDGGNINKVGNTTRTAVGNEMSAFYGLRTDGIFHSLEELNAYKVNGTLIQPNAKVGDVKFVDKNGDGKIDDNDRTFLGSYFPTYSGGINLSLEYKGIDLKAFGQFVYGSKIVNALKYWDESVNGATNSLTSRMNRYDPVDNPNGTDPRMTILDPNNNMRFSDRYVENGSYFRLKTLQLGYSLPTSLISKFGVKLLRIYVAADNLFTITKYTGYEPDLGELVNANSATTTGNTAGFTYFGVDQATWPSSRVFRVGLNLNF